MSGSKREQKLPWARTSVANLARYQSSGIYFARVRVAGKLIRQTLKTDVFPVTQIRLADLIQEQRKAAEAGQFSSNGKMSFADARKIYESFLILYKEHVLSNPGIEGSEIRVLPAEQFCAFIVVLSEV